MFSLLTSSVACENWAVIFTGSNQFYNYRHTADSYYQYQVLKAGGYPDNRIIMMCYDDIVTSSENPFKGQIFRELDHTNVYPGRENIDYFGTTVTAANWYKVLTGDSSAGVALQSTANDDVFVFFDDHGGSGILGVPDGCGDYIYADDLKNALQTMHDKKLYQTCFFPITACYAGSVAQELNDIPNLYIWTASGIDESSYAVMWDDSIDEYLSSEFSYVFSHYQQDHCETTLGDAFPDVRDGVKQSHVMKFGDTALEFYPLSKWVGKQNGVKKPERPLTRVLADEVEAKLSTLSMKKGPEAKAAFAAEKAAAERIENLCDSLKRMFCGNSIADLTKTPSSINWNAYKKVIRTIQAKTPHMPEAFWRQTPFLANLCNIAEADKIVSAINRIY